MNNIKFQCNYGAVVGLGINGNNITMNNHSVENKVLNIKGIEKIPVREYTLQFTIVVIPWIT